MLLEDIMAILDRQFDAGFGRENLPRVEEAIRKLLVGHQLERPINQHEFQQALLELRAAMHHLERIGY
jgi:hypothetical protein